MDSLEPHLQSCADEARAAAEAGWQFIGVTYGWGITPDMRNFPLATSLHELKAQLLARLK